MNRRTSISLTALLASIITSCQHCPPPCPEDPVCEKYVHRYGVDLPQDDWISRGQSGQIISKMKDGATVSKNYNNGILEGDTTYSFPHSTLVQRTETYSKGYLIKEVVSYPSGVPMQQTTYESPTSKTVLTWYETSAPHSKESYDQGLLVEGEYYLPSGQLESKVEMKEGIKMNRDQLGLLISRDEIKDGMIVLKTEYYPSGTPKTVASYSHGELNGQVVTYLVGGEPSCIEQWSSGKQDGLTVVYQNGEKYAEVPFVNGVRHGVEKRYHDGKDVIEEITWNNGVRHGPSYVYVDGAVKTQWYFQDKEVSKASFEMLSRPIP